MIDSRSPTSRRKLFATVRRNRNRNGTVSKRTQLELARGGGGTGTQQRVEQQRVPREQQQRVEQGSLKREGETPLRAGAELQQNAGGQVADAVETTTRDREHGRRGEQQSLARGTHQWSPPRSGSAAAQAHGTASTRAARRNTRGRRAG
mmetsp:Transcript_26018/g.65573  ORF Transcript_26018/g.65573 Transcript_26018/m.65573 type:complete len:149 (-) Transcript_26018:659-1105(-)